jgi:sugar lactone lactonase YvrE
MQRSQKTIWDMRFGRILAYGVLVLVCAGCWSSAPANDGVPAGVEKIKKTHKQVKAIDLRAIEKGARLQDFCVARDGTVVALVAGALPIGDAGPSDGKADNPASRSQVCILDADGKLVRKWDVSFLGQAIGAGPDGSVYVGGNARLARFDAQGKLLAEADAPQTAILADKDELREQAQEQLESEKAAAEQQIKNYEAILKDEKQLAEQQKQIEKQLEEQRAEEAKKDAKEKPEGKPAEQPRIEYDLKKIYTQQLDYLRKQKDQTVDQVITSITYRLKQINAITTSGSDVFVACPMSKGYGYAVWRTDQAFENPKQIVKDLSGCCGQMDIQAAGDLVFVAENSRHRVVRYSRDGAEVGSFGTTDREGLGAGFGGCCNPMNLCFTVDGGLLAAESNGVVKRFTPDGEYQGMVGVAEVPAGCKNSAIGISSDGDRVYYIDIQGSKILVLARNGGSAGSE